MELTQIIVIFFEIMLLVVLRKCNLNFIRNKNWTTKASQHAIQHHAGHLYCGLTTPQLKQQYELS